MLRLLVSLFLSLACAQALADPPLRVARLAYVHGPVSFSPAGTDEWAVASLNRPLVAGDRVWTDPAGRDELQLGGAALRMDGNTLLSILTLDDRALQVQLSQGTLNVRVRPGPAAGTIEIDTPNLALAIDQPGHYRIGVDPAGNTTAVRVDDGQAQAMGRYQAYTINPGQYLRFSGPDLRSVQAIDPRYRDDFDRWAAARDQRAERALAVRYVSPATIGYDDLDDYGTWRTVPAYGHVWVPRGVKRGWAPYRDGHWAWIEPWGWTWIDDAPWGFAVTHYGRWANLDGDWAWVPEPANAMPVYAPALVVFAAVGNNMVRGPREPAVAWFPLGPRERYRPSYQASPRYLSAINYNITNVTNNAYVNRQAVTAVPASAFTHAQPVRNMAMTMPRERMAQAPVMAAPQVQAGRESLASRLSAGHRPAQALLARPAMTHMRPAIAHAPPQPAALASQVTAGPQHPEHRDHGMAPAQTPAAFAHGPAMVPAARPPLPEPRMPGRGGREEALHPAQAHAPAPSVPHPGLEAERRAMQAMHQPHHPPVPETQVLPQHAPPFAQAQARPAHEPPPVGPMHPALQRIAHEPPHPQPVPHAELPRPLQEPQRAPHEPPHAQPAPHTEHVPPPHAQPAPHAEPPQHSAPPQEHQPPHPAAPQAGHPAEPGKAGPEHGQRGHKDEHR
ncbi:MAG: DUF6600 domain-containing protein [Telluria sp.]